MSELKQEILSREFSEYRQAEIKAASDFVHRIWNEDPKYIRGALDMINRILKIPETCSPNNEDEKSILRTIVQRDIKKFEAEILSKSIIDNSDE